MIESVLVVVCCLILWIAVHGGLPIPTSRSASRSLPIRYRKLRFHFSMRTMLIALTLAALLLGFVSWLNHTPN
jgi:hypothetical protein